MTDTEIIKAVAELDGIPIERLDICMCGDSREEYHEHPFTPMLDWSNVPRYLTSRDAIVPVVEKQSVTTQHKTFHELCCMNLGTTGCFLFSAKQLCEALLKAVGKYKD